MLRLRAALFTVGISPAVASQVVRDFSDPYIELVRLLYEACNIEHALLVQYLAAAFSIKPTFPLIAGSAIGPNSFSLFGIAVQEMQHLGTVNRLLTVLAATPRLDRDDFPIQASIYPFPLEIVPLSRASLARYSYVEAPASVFDANAPQTDKDFAALVLGLLGHQNVNHLGGLYSNILARLQEVMAAPPAGVGDLSDFPDELEAIKDQGEGSHYLFFRSLLEGTAPSLSGPNTWMSPSSASYPSLDLKSGYSAFAGDPKAIPDEDARVVGWLANLHYWTTLSLLDLSFRFANSSYAAASMGHMRGPLYQLGFELAKHGYCVPFDLPTIPIPWAQSEVNCRSAVRRLAIEAKEYAEAIKHLLPPGFSSDSVDATIELLK